MKKPDTPIEPPVRCATLLLWAGVIASVDTPVRAKVIDGVTFLVPVDDRVQATSA